MNAQSVGSLLLCVLWTIIIIMDDYMRIMDDVSS